MRVLVIVHLEADFQVDESLILQIIKYSKTFDHTINITSAAALTGTEMFYELRQFHSEEWIWGFDPSDPACTYKKGVDYISTNGHEYSEILPWMKKLKKDKAFYTLVGGNRFECLQDIYDIWQHLGLKTRIKEALTY